MADILSWEAGLKSRREHAFLFRTLALRQVEADKACVNAVKTTDDANIIRVKTVS